LNFDIEVSDEIKEVLEKECGELNRKDIEIMYGAKGDSLKALMLYADFKREEICGNVVTYVVNRNINFTNLCIGSCQFCAFRNKNGFLLPFSEIKKRVREALKLKATEVCIQGGLHPDIDLEFYVEILNCVREVSDSIHIHAFSPMEVYYGAKKSRVTVKSAIRTLRENGLGSMPGTAAEILSKKTRSKICPSKLGVSRWIKVIETAHKEGVPTTATMMYGHIEDIKERAKHLEIIKKIQEKTHGFTEFVPLTFIHENTGIKNYATGAEDIRTYAISRIFFDREIPNIQVSWVKLGPKFAELCLLAGANDIGGTLYEENISKSAGSPYGSYMPVAEMRRIIEDIGRVPVERDTLYNYI